MDPGAKEQPDVDQPHENGSLRVAHQSITTATGDGRTLGRIRLMSNDDAGGDLLGRSRRAVPSMGMSTDRSNSRFQLGRGQREGDGRSFGHAWHEKNPEHARGTEFEIPEGHLPHLVGFAMTYGYLSVARRSARAAAIDVTTVRTARPQSIARYPGGLRVAPSRLFPEVCLIGLCVADRALTRLTNRRTILCSEAPD